MRFLIYDDALKNAPGVLLVHDWMGISDGTKSKATEIAKNWLEMIAPWIFSKLIP